MSTFFNRERFGNAQIAAGLLLVIFIIECAWLVAHERAFDLSPDQLAQVQAGVAQWRGHQIAGTPVDLQGTRTYDSRHSPLWYLIPAVPVALFNVPAASAPWFWLTRAPYILFGTVLGASLWYVSRRLYGNAGGFIALGLYCFSPAVIRTTALWFSQPHIGAAWGLFGAVFTAIAVSHTLYAPREVVLWNWRRIMLLGVSLALAIGAQFDLVIVIPLLLGFMLYLAPERKASAIAILSAAIAVALALLFASYFLHPVLFWYGLLGANFLSVAWPALAMGGAYIQLLKEIAAAGPVMALLAPGAVIGYVLWKRCRYFGNTAPLIVAGLFAILRVVSPHAPDSVFGLTTSIFLFVFVAGIAADLLETRHREGIAAVLIGLLAANAVWNVFGLARI